MGFFSDDAPKNKVVALFDIGNASVGAALLELPNGNGRPKILFSIRKEIAMHESPDSERFFKRALTTIDQVAGELLRKGYAAPEEVFCVLAAPWIISQTRFLYYDRSRPFIFSKRMADELIQRELTSYEEGLIKEYRDLYATHDLLEHKVMQVRLNGYVTRTPIGKQAQKVEVASFMSMIPQALHDGLYAHFQKSFHTRITLHSFLFALFSSVKTAFKHADDCLLIDISGELTEIGVVRDDVLMQSISFPFGKNTILRSLGGAFSLSPKESESLLRMYLSNSLEKGFETKVHRVLVQAEASFHEGIEKAFAQISETDLLPNDAFLTADEELLPWCQRALASEVFAPMTARHKAIHVTPLTLPALKGYIIDNEQKHDPFLILAAVFYTIYQRKTHSL